MERHSPDRHSLDRHSPDWHSLDRHSPDWHSPDEVAGILGLHVRTVRGYIRDGRLPAVRIGKQYRVAHSDLAAFTGRPRAEPTVHVTTVVEVEDVPVGLADRLTTLVVAGAQQVPGLRVQTVHDASRGHLKLIVLGPPSATGDVLQTIDTFLKAEGQ
ncbi:helix-turn-helix domain-containing protein [Actinoplanes sp. NPDC049265]|uniref:helix-turn-helix domain-containing protein n=1 Tax=Actinoplanes sp. NPDC049265 TaxID=3363902 RepID=UPI003716A036